MWPRVVLSGLVLFIILTAIAPVWAADDHDPSAGLSAPIFAIKESGASVDPATAARLAAAFGATWQKWIDPETSNAWNAAELKQIRAILDDTLAALSDVGLDGAALLAGYRFRRVAGEYVRPDKQYVALANHEQQTIILGTAAFVRLQGFYIYHELGHAVDHRLERRLGDAFHSQAGSGYTAKQQWLTGAGYWMRPHARDARSEATADAFALWVSSNYGKRRPPVFGGSPADLNYESIGLAAQGALHSMVSE
ncbi:MAG: hypothetical protein R3300_04990 [Candidatus Promineifilaceae bacterium]|nr:hypothetical protein [Candidatus Promineifilaceae bacterium]